MVLVKFGNRNAERGKGRFHLPRQPFPSTSQQEDSSWTSGGHEELRYFTDSFQIKPPVGLRPTQEETSWIYQFAQMIRKWYQWGQMSALHQKSKQPRWKCLVVACWGSGGTLALIYNGCMRTPSKMIMCLHYHSWPFACFLFFQVFLSGAFWGETGKENDKNNKGENHTSFWSKSQKKNAQTRQFHQLSSNYLTETIQILLWHVQRCKKKNITKNGKIAQDPRWRFSSKKIN